MKNLSAHLETFQAAGFTKKALVSDKQMETLAKAFDAREGVLETPESELRYIEGLADLPIGFLTEFKVLPAPGSEKCACGRVPTALDIIKPAFKRQIHDKSLIRDTLIGFDNLVEIAKDGRQGECIACGRAIVMAGYRSRRYMYA